METGSRMGKFPNLGADQERPEQSGGVLNNFFTHNSEEFGQGFSKEVEAFRVPSCWRGASIRHPWQDGYTTTLTS